MSRMVIQITSISFTPEGALQQSVDHGRVRRTCEHPRRSARLVKPIQRFGEAPQKSCSRLGGVIKWSNCLMSPLVTLLWTLRRGGRPHAIC
jgi:hypothetical protein